MAIRDTSLRPYQKILLYLCLAFGQLILVSQKYTFDISQYSIYDGLEKGSVSAIFKDKDQFLWVATYDDLQRYDGYEFKSYLLDEIPIERFDILKIGQRKNGDIWFLIKDQIRKTYSVYFLDPQSGTIRDMADFTSPDDIRAIESISQNPKYTLYFNDSVDRFFFSTPTHTGCYIIDSGMVKMSLPNQLKDSSLVRIQFVDSEQNYWLINEGTNLMVILNQLGQVKDQIPVRTSRNLRQDEIIYFGERVVEWESQIYFTGLLNDDFDSHNKLYRYDADGRHEMIFEIPEGYVFGDIIQGQIWCIGEKAWRVYSLSGGLLQTFSDSDYENFFFKGFDRNKINRLGSGQFALPSFQGFTIISIKENRFTNYLPNKNLIPGFRTNAARGLLVVDESVLVNFEFAGLVRFQKNKPEEFDLIVDEGYYFNADLDENNEYKKEWYTGFSIIQDDHKNYYLSSRGNLSIWSSDLEFQSEYLFPNNYRKGYYNPWTSWMDKKQCIWTVHRLGLIKICPQTGSQEVMRYEDHGFEKQVIQVYHVLNHPANATKWLSTDQGLYLFDPNSQKVIQRYSVDGENANYLPAQVVHHLHIDQNNHYWLATNSGLIEWNQSTNEKKIYNRQDGLSNDNIYAVMEDDYNRLWLSSDYGIMSFDKESYDVYTYLPKDGITTEEFNRTSHYQDSNGNIYFGSISGVTSFDPADFQKDEKEYASVHLTGFEVFDGDTDQLTDIYQSVYQSNSIDIKPGDLYFKLKYVLPTTGEKSKTLYAWKIDGIYDQWSYQKENSLQFAALPYGQHQLQIKGQTDNGGWSPNVLSLNLNILKPYYLRPWFLILSLLSALATIMYLFRRRTQILIRQQLLLEAEIQKATAQIKADKKTIEAQAEGLREMDKVKSRFFADISHEFRTPLTLILGPIRQAMSKSKALQADDLNLIERNSLKLLRLINQILDLSKLEDKQMKTFYVYGDMVTMVGNAVNNFQTLALSEQKTLNFHSNQGQIVMDYDKQKIQDIIYNLISNALKFTVAGDQIDVKLEQLEMGLSLSVIDSGSGIAPEHLPHLFDRFHQVDGGYVSNTSKGSGIGLSLVKQLIELMEGQISVTSELGNGSNFTITLPIRRKATQKDEDTAAFIQSIPTVPATNMNRIKPNEVPSPISTSDDRDLIQVLIIEDTYDLAMHIASCMPDHYQVNFAENGQVGIHKAFNDIPDIIISDVMMPEKDGFEVCEMLKTNEATSHIPIILLTALAEVEARIKGLKRGADAYLAKPFEEEELLVRISSLIKLRKTLQERYSRLALDPYASPEELSEFGAELSIENQFILKLKQTVLDSYRDSNFDVQALTVKIGMSGAQLRRKSKALIACTPNEYIRDFRIARSKELLSHSSHTIAEIAYQVGFNDPSYFTRVFQKVIGQAPKEYRESIKN